MNAVTLRQYGRKLTAALALVVSLLLCYAAGRLNTGEAVLARMDGGTKEARLTYISELGWSVKSEESVESVLLPETFDSAYESFLSIQRECGFDLLPYAGQTVERYSYDVTNYPDYDGPVRLSLLVAQGQIIGGEVHASSLDGFMHSLIYPGSNSVHP